MADPIPAAVTATAPPVSTPTDHDLTGAEGNWHVCNSSWNDPKLRFDHADFLWCPRHAGTPRHFECTRLIAPEMVLKAIDRVPGVVPTRAEALPVQPDLTTPVRQPEDMPA